MKTDKILLLLALVFAIIVSLRKVFKKKKSDFVPVDSSGDVAASSSGATMSPDEAKRLASQLYDAMKDFGTDTETISNVRSKIGTADNMRILYNAFGKKEYGTFGAPLYSWLPSDSYDLKGWIIKEVSGTEKKEWLKLFNLIGM